MTQGLVNPEEILDLGLSSRKSSEAYQRLFSGLSTTETEDLDKKQGRYLGLSQRSHPSGIETFSLVFKEPFQWDSFSAATELLTDLRGADLLRVKGIINVDGRPLVIQGVQHIFHPPVELDAWPSENRDSRLVFIARKLQPDSIRLLFEASRSLQATSK